MNFKTTWLSMSKILFAAAFLMLGFFIIYEKSSMCFYLMGVFFVSFLMVDLILYSNKDAKRNGNSPKLDQIKMLKEKITSQKNEIDSLCSQSKAVSEELSCSLININEIQNELELKNEELEVLRRVSEVITSTFDLSVIVKYLYKVFNRFTGCDRYFICLPDKKTGELVCKYEFGETTYNEEGHVYSQSSSSVMSCFKNGQPSIVTNVFIKIRNAYGDKMSMPLYVRNELTGVLFMESGEPGTFSDMNVEFIESLAIYAAIAINNAQLFYNTFNQKQYIQKGYLQTVMALANSIEAKDAYTRGHCQRVMEIACEISKYAGESREEIDKLRYSAVLHDIGKIGIPACILNKQGPLTEEEYGEIKKHPLISYNILKDVEFIKSGLDIILQHHERYDGAGYPYGLKGNEICKSARILCIADAFDAMITDRPYRKGMSVEEAVMEIERCKGTQFDPEICDIFIKMLH